MILKYNKFKFTSLINEAIMQYDKDFLTIISDIKFKTKNNIADVILSTSNRDIDNKENYIRISNGKSDMVEFKNDDKVERDGFTSVPFSEIKIGRIIRRILDTVKYIYNDKEIEDFVNLYKSEIETRNGKFSEFKIVKGEQIKKYYLIDNYSYEDEGSLQKSCMSLERCQKYLDIYTKNPDKVSLLVQLEEETERVKGRALIWKLDKPQNYTFLDRIYTTHEKDINIFKRYADEKGWLYRDIQNYEFEDITILNKDIRMNFVDIEIKLNNFNFKQYPYIDTTPYLTKDGILTNSKLKAIAFLRDTEGKDFHCINCEGVGHVPCEDCLGKGCDNCDEIGHIECDLCSNVSRV